MSLSALVSVVIIDKGVATAGCIVPLITSSFSPAPQMLINPPQKASTLAKENRIRLDQVGSFKPQRGVRRMVREKKGLFSYIHVATRPRRTRAENS